MSIFSFFRNVAATGSFSEAYLVSVSGTSPRNWHMRTEVMRDDAEGKGPHRVVIHQGRGAAVRKLYDKGSYTRDIQQTARDTSPKQVETDWRQPMGHPRARESGGDHFGWEW